jgi:hypothetical protein
MNAAPDHLELEQRIREMVLRTSSPAKHAARSALRHIDTAVAIRDIDPEMAAFRAITAEEEAATAVFRALQGRKYIGAHRMDPRNHVHKAALRPFLVGVGEFLFRSAEKLHLEVQLRWREKKPKDKLQIVLRPTKGPLVGREMISPLPLEFDAKVNGAPYDFSEELAKVVTLRRAKSIEKHIRELANRRNRMLYASPDGIPAVAGPIDKPLARSKDRVLGHLIVVLLIDQYPQQLFVQQALNAFRQVISKIDPRVGDR